VRKGAFAYDDLPALAADPRRAGRAYAVWTRLEHRYGKLQSVSAVVFSRTVDGGRTWSPPARLGTGHNYAAALAVARSGDVYLALAREGELVLRRSRDGGRTWSGARQVGVLPGPFFAGCAHGNAFLPAVPRTCVGVSPSVVVLPGGGPFVTWAAPDADGTHAVWAARFDASLQPLESGRVGPRDRKPADQFGPAAAVDATTGAVWVCYYDTTGDPQRKRTWYTCTASRDGGRSWGVPVRAAATRSDETKVSAGLFAYGDRQAVVAARGVAHPLWTDGRRLLPDGEEIYATSIPLSRVR
jgi:hypothetical protein